ncbi:MAG: tRNA 4-thiouridine(8) synthase ThiI [Oscillospiraceae bacterium]|nr:tRNA 4-thiouridine(8) synthase ThiI [Oscillospiraceae bacterium]
MQDIILLKQGEIVLKGLNKRYFEQKLLQNVKRRLAPLGAFGVECLQSTVYIRAEDERCDLDAAVDAMTRVFGVASVVRAAACEKTPEAMARKAVEYMRSAMLSAGSFKVETKRADKSFPLTSIQVSQYVGGELADAYPGTRVDVHDPELTVHVEVRETHAYLHGSPLPGAGGLPAGTGGTAVTLLSGGIDSPVSTWMTAKRGVHMIPVHFFSFPYTSELAKQKVLDLAKVLTQYCGRMTVEVVPFTRIQTEIRDKCPEEYFTLIMRRFMMRIAQAVADRNGAKALVTGENLGQVASQTLEALGCTEAVTRLPVLRPLIGFDKEEIVQLARKIGTFELSTLPYEDCCTVFTPRHPRTKPRVEAVEEAEAVLDIDALVREALENIERVRIEPGEDVLTYER